MRVVLLSPATPLTPAPMQILPLPVVRALPEVVPTATLFDPVVFDERAPGPVAVLKLPVVLLESTKAPLAALKAPVLLL